MASAAPIQMIDDNDMIEEEQLQLRKYIQENYSKFCDVERELTNLTMEMKFKARTTKADWDIFCADRVAEDDLHHVVAATGSTVQTLVNNVIDEVILFHFIQLSNYKLNSGLLVICMVAACVADVEEGCKDVEYCISFIY